MSKKHLKLRSVLILKSVLIVLFSATRFVKDNYGHLLLLFLTDAAVLKIEKRSTMHLLEHQIMLIICKERLKFVLHFLAY